MTQTEFERTAFHKGQPAIFDGLIPVQIFGVDFDKGEVFVVTVDGNAKWVSRDFIELLHPDPLSLLREIHKRIDGDPMGEGWQTRLDADLWEQLKKLIGK